MLHDDVRASTSIQLLNIILTITTCFVLEVVFAPPLVHASRSRSCPRGDASAWMMGQLGAGSSSSY